METETGHNDQPLSATSTPSTDVRGTIGHYALFGAPNANPIDDMDIRERVTSESWGGASEFESPVTVPWVLEVRRDDLKKLIIGYVPEAMEDKWFIFSEGGNDSSGPEWETLRVVFSSSWSGDRLFDLNVAVSAVVDENGLPEAWVKSITFETGTNQDEEDIEESPEAWAKETAREVCSWVLDVELGPEQSNGG